ncbi:ATP-binding protein [Marinobacter sp. F3R08]|uniref:ATP-binding protein n=1 Tax=Marinobacter sp. F3R08 TaxID=2841559 RepID=UPI001C094D58|nr:ATP-binding protein [Marinobacter sp. F3R08]MBU2952182.1 ATP-binding protein [Marinobacter sp. F3R08]
MSIDWHYPRHDLTERVIEAFDKRVSNTLTLFAPRRMGKTEFVLHDLIPAAEKRGFVPVYASFWDNRDDPTSSLLHAINAALAQRSWWKRATNRIAGAQLKVKAGADGVEAGMSVTASQPVAPTPSSLDELRDQFAELLQRHDRILLCLDEAQHLATSQAFENLVFFLRTLLDRNFNKIYVMYTGSSRDGLRKLFSRRKAALFQSSSQIELPDLGAGFVEHMRNCFKQATGREFSYSEGQRAFALLHYVPREFRSVIEKMILTGADDILNEAAVANDDQLEDSGYPILWKSLKAIDQGLLIWIASGNAALYQDPCKEFLADRLGVDSVETHTIQNAINRLRGEYLSLVSHGTYEFEDARFRDWVVMHCEE